MPLFYIFKYYLTGALFCAHMNHKKNLQKSFKKAIDNTIPRDMMYIVTGGMTWMLN